jgi:hypothetical protein
MTGGNLLRVLPRAYYTAPIANFLSASSEVILGTLTTNSDFAVDQSQRDAWLQGAISKKPERQMYLRNAYRVLLTRARQGMVIFIPRGDTEDPTRMPAFYDSTFNYLAGLGIPIIAS